MNRGECFDLVKRLSGYYWRIINPQAVARQTSLSWVCKTFNKTLDCRELSILGPASESRDSMAAPWVANARAGASLRC